MSIITPSDTQPYGHPWSCRHPGCTLNIYDSLPDLPDAKVKNEYELPELL